MRPYELKTTTHKVRRGKIITLGDSLTDPQGNAGSEHTRWQEQLRRVLENNGAEVRILNLGQSGSKSGGGQLKAALNRMSPWVPNIRPADDIPQIANIYLGTNDFRAITGVTRSGTTATYTSTSHGYATGDVLYITGFTETQYNGWKTISNVTTDTYDVTGVTGTPTTPGTIAVKAWSRLDTFTNIRSLIRWVQFGCVGFVDSQTNLPATGRPGERWVVKYDTSTTGGRSVPAGNCVLPNITGSITNNSLGNSEPTAWEFRSGQTGESGWGRVGRASTAPTHVKYVTVCTNHFLNYASGGDTTSVEFYLYDSSNVNCLRNVQASVVTAEASANVVLVDLFTYFKNLILTGVETAGSNSWHRVANDIHFSQLGYAYIANAIADVILSKPDWMVSISPVDG